MHSYCSWVKEEIIMKTVNYLEYNEDICGMQLKQYFASKCITLKTFIKISLLKNVRV